MGEEYLRGVVYLLETLATHLKNSNLVCSAKTVLQATQNAVGVVAITLELKHHIHYMLQNLGACDRAIFGDVANDEYGDVVALGNLEERCGALTNLRHTAG